MKQFLVAIMTGTLLLCGCASTAENTAVSSTSSMTKSSVSAAEYEDAALELLDASQEIQTADDGTAYIIVNARYTNHSSEAQYAYSSFAVKAFQDDSEINDISDINGNQASLVTEVKKGKSIDVSYCFQPSMIDGTPIEVQVCEPTAEQKVLLTKGYTVQAINAATE